MKNIGVNHIQVRSDIYNTWGEVKDLEFKINRIAEDLNSSKVIYNLTEHFDIKFHSPTQDTLNNSFEICNGAFLWPTIGANLSLYPCAHVATSEYKELFSLNNTKSISSLYSPLYRDNLKCHQVKCGMICTPIIKK